MPLGYETRSGKEPTIQEFIQQMGTAGRENVEFTSDLGYYLLDLLKESGFGEESAFNALETELIKAQGYTNWMAGRTPEESEEVGEWHPSLEDFGQGDVTFQQGYLPPEFEASQQLGEEAWREYVGESYGNPLFARIAEGRFTPSTPLSGYGGEWGDFEFGQDVPSEIYGAGVFDPENVRHMNIIDALGLGFLSIPTAESYGLSELVSNIGATKKREQRSFLEEYMGSEPGRRYNVLQGVSSPEDERSEMNYLASQFGTGRKYGRDIKKAYKGYEEEVYGGIKDWLASLT